MFPLFEWILKLKIFYNFGRNLRGFDTFDTDLISFLKISQGFKLSQNNWLQIHKALWYLCWVRCLTKTDVFFSSVTLIVLLLYILVLFCFKEFFRSDSSLHFFHLNPHWKVRKKSKSTSNVSIRKILILYQTFKLRLKIKCYEYY